MTKPIGNVYFDVDVSNGFVWIETVEDGLFVQGCIDQETGKVHKGDCGLDWGICGEVNEEAFETYGESVCEKVFYEQVEAHGLLATEEDY